MSFMFRHLYELTSETIAFKVYEVFFRQPIILNEQILHFRSPQWKEPSTKSLAF